MNKIILLIIAASLAGCATPAQRFAEAALELDFKAEIIASAQFQHQVYSSNPLMGRKTLHVYLDGDGTPWERNRWVAVDPTARNPLILRLMAQDKQAAILLGRPCYYGLNHSSECHNKYWTSHRYSKEVVDSMASVLNTWLTRYKFNDVVLIGYSGGGSIAMLMADKIKNLMKVVTVSANLNVTAWSQFHGYSALKESLNPADETKLNEQVEQFHFAGQDDDIVPAFIINEYSDSQKNAKYYELAETDHSCCWEDKWPAILRIIE